MDGSLPRARRCVIALAVCALTTGGCAGWNATRIDPTGERLLVTGPAVALPAGVPIMRPTQLPRPLTAGPIAVQQPVVSAPIASPPPMSAPPIGAPPTPVGPAVVTSPPPLPSALPVAVLPGIGPRRTLSGGRHAGGVGLHQGKSQPLLAGANVSGLKAIAISPPELFAPVGSQVVLRAGVCGHDGQLVPGTPVEWMLSPDSTGQFVQVGETGKSHFLHWTQEGVGKINNNYAIGSTSRSARQLPPTTLAPLSSVNVMAGESWVTLASPTEGTSHITALSSNIDDFQLRTSFAKVHWIDARWTFPPPAVNPVGSAHTFTTTVSRSTDGAAIAGWYVRYEIVGGAPAGFAPDGAQVIEVPTDELGQANVEIVEQGDAGPGITRVGIQVIRPALHNALDDRRLILGVGATTKTWTAPDVAIRATGPAQGNLGDTLTYRLDVTNPGTLPVSNATVTLPIPPGLVYVDSDLPPTTSGNEMTWSLGELPAGALRTVSVRFRVDRQGTFNLCANVRTAEGLSAQDCVAISAAQARPDIRLQLNGPSTADVGATVRYEVVVTNISNTVAKNLVITDTFDDGFQHLVDESPIEKELGEVLPGQSRSVFISFQVTKPGELCHTVDVTGDGGLSATARACLVARQTATQPLTQPGPQPRPQTAPQPRPRPAITLSKSGPAQRRVGEVAKFSIEITNTGDVPLTNLRIEDRYDRVLEPTDATEGYAVDGEGLPVDEQGRPADLLFWRLARLEPGKTHKLQVHCVCGAVKASACNRVTVVCDQRPIVVADDACLEILPEIEPPPKRDPPERPPPKPDESPAAGAAATEAGTVDTPVAGPADVRHTIASFKNPARVGEQVKYQIDVVNHGQSSDKSVALVIKFPPQMRPVQVGTVSPVRCKIADGQIVFEPVAELRAGEPIQFVIPFEIVGAGNVQIDAVLTSDTIRQPASKTADVEILAP